MVAYRTCVPLRVHTRIPLGARLVGHDLYRMVRAGMPADWTAAERVVALIIADVCNDRTRTGFISNEDLCAESGVAPSSLRAILGRLGAHGFELRVPISHGKDGRPVYATTGRGRGGRAVDYRCPYLPPRDAKDVTLIATSGENRDEDHEKRDEDIAPTPSNPTNHLPDQSSYTSLVTTEVESRVRAHEEGQTYVAAGYTLCQSCGGREDATIIEDGRCRFCRAA